MKITYTLTDESPALATRSLLPIIEAFCARFRICVETADISLSGRILASFPQKNDAPDGLKILANLVQNPDANIIKTPNISASVPQLKAAISELQNLGYNAPHYIEDPKTDEQKRALEIYKKILGSAVNPVLRDGNSKRKSTKSVKEFAKKFPHKILPLAKNSKTVISSMNNGDFYENEHAILVKKNATAKIIFTKNSGEKMVLKQDLALQNGEILDATFMSVAALRAFYDEQIARARDENLMLSLHLKTTMMKISDPVLFGVFVEAFFAELFETHGDELEHLGANPKNGMSEILDRVKNSPKSAQILKIYEKTLASTPIAYVSPGRTNLHVPSDVIIDASMPALFKNGAQMWDENDRARDTNALIPDRTYAQIYTAVLDDLHKNGALDPKTLGSVSNIGLMAKKAQEYGSHDKTFIAPTDGVFTIETDEILLRHEVSAGDIYRVNEAKPEALENWIELGIDEAVSENLSGIFWLDEKRASDKIIISLVREKLVQNPATKIQILDPKTACEASLAAIRSGENIISITGNVLRDYLTDLFPILELGTSAKMLSIVPMLGGGAMFETGAGGSAPKQMTQLLNENHLRWDSLGEFLALQASLEFYAAKNSAPDVQILAEALDLAILDVLDGDKSPKRDAGTDDNRTSHFYLAKFLAARLKTAYENASDPKNAEFWAKISQEFTENEQKIREEFLSNENKAVEIGGYYKFDENLAAKIMRPSATFNAIIQKIAKVS